MTVLIVIIAEGMMSIYSDQQLAADMKQKGWQHAQKFAPEICAANVMKVYKSL